MKVAKKQYYENRVHSLEQNNPSKWWKQIESISGETIQQQWHHQFVGDYVDMEALVNSINDYFVGITEDFVPLKYSAIPIDVPEELLVTEDEVFRSLSRIKINKATGPDCIPNKLLKDFAIELSPIIADIYNQSLKEGSIPTILKSSIVTPILKITPPSDIKADLRPISLTCTLAKVLEGFTCVRLLPQLTGKIDPRQYARKGHSTTDALLYMLRAIYEALDTGDNAVRIFLLISLKFLT